jgi:hypothetical protein
MNVSIDVLPLPENIKVKLREHGFLFVNDLQEIGKSITYYYYEQYSIDFTTLIISCVCTYMF